MTKILDCTLRDGGYYNDWNFPIDIARRTVSGLNEAGVNIIEIGLKSAADNQCSGLFKYCNEEYLGFLNDFPNVTFSFMLNVKEFIVNGEVDRDALDKIILPADKSVFNMCRLASHFADIDLISDFHNYFAGQGYQVGINLMGISLLDNDQIHKSMNIVEKIQPDVFYVADSFGSMLPEDVSVLVAMLRQYYSGRIGIHTHDNQGLAFSNTLRAIEEGVEYVDATLTGMGRGAGNLATEQILLWLQNRGKDKSSYHSSKVLDIIHEYFGPLKERFKWGFNYVYMLSGLNNIHPVYCMELCDGNKFSMSHISSILEAIPHEHHASFSREALTRSINNNSKIKGVDVFQLPVFSQNKKRADSLVCLIVSTGPGIVEYQQAINNLVLRKKWQVIECNDSGVVDQISDRLTVVLNKMRLDEIIAKPIKLEQMIVTGERSLEDAVDVNLFHYPYKIDTLGFNDDGVSIPDFEAGQYAISLAISLGYREILLAGFTGYDDPERNTSMVEYFSALSSMVDGISLTSVTPTQYKNLNQKSIYTL